MNSCEQTKLLQRQAGLIDVSDRTLIKLSGADRATFLHNMCTNDIKKLSPGTNVEAFITDVRGKTVGHVTVLCTDDALYLETVRNQSETLINQLDRYVIREDVQLQEVAAAKKLLLAGPEAPRILADRFGFGQAGRGLRNAIVDTAGGELIVAAMPWSEHAWLLVFDEQNAGTLPEEVTTAGAVNCEQAAFEPLRIAYRYPWFDVDFDASNLPQELDRDARAISFTKGCYLGQETVARIDALGHVNRILSLVKSESEVATGTELSFDGKSVGVISSIAPQIDANGWQGLAMLRREHSSAGNILTAANAAVEVVGAPKS